MSERIVVRRSAGDRLLQIMNLFVMLVLIGLLVLIYLDRMGTGGLKQLIVRDPQPAEQPQPAVVQQWEQQRQQLAPPREIGQPAWPADWPRGADGQPLPPQWGQPAGQWPVDWPMMNGQPVAPIQQDPIMQPDGSLYSEMIPLPYP